MKSIIVLLVVISVAFAQNAYTNKFDNLDVDAILRNPRILSNYVKCLLDKAPCTAEGRELKKTLPDALVSDCSKCNEKQKAAAEKVTTHLRTTRPADWKSLLAKYDPQGNFQKRFEAQQRAQKV